MQTAENSKSSTVCVWDLKHNMDSMRLALQMLLTMRLALQMWCLMRPPPSIIIPVFLA